MNELKLSLIVPVFNEEDNIAIFVDKFIRLFQQKIDENRIELIFVDDGSVDNSWQLILKYGEKFKWIKGLSFSFNVGSHLAIMAGINICSGDYLVFTSVDLQDPLDNILEMEKKYEYGSEIVWAVRNKRHNNSVIEKLISFLYYYLLRKGGIKNLPPTGASMFLLGKKAIEAIKLYKERNIALEGVFGIIGFKQDVFYYERKERQYGKSKWTLLKKIKLFLDGILGFSYYPIRIASVIGVIIFLLSVVGIFYIVLNKLIFNVVLPGWSSLMVLVSFFSGLQFLILGILGEYIWRTLDEVRSRPKYIIKEKVNL